jgi:hypothetical protein
MFAVYTAKLAKKKRPANYGGRRQQDCYKIATEATIRQQIGLHGATISARFEPFCYI